MLNSQAITDWQDGNSLKVASVTGTGGQGVLQSVEDYNRSISGTDKISWNGNLSEGDETYTEPKQTMIKCLSSLWKKNKNNEIRQLMIHAQADKLRAFDDTSFNKAVLLNYSDGAGTLGHNAVMLINKNGYGVVFSVFSTKDKALKSIYTDAELRFSVLTPEQVNILTKNNGEKKLISGMPATDGNVTHEYYNNYVEFEITNDQGTKMYEFATTRYDCPGNYKLLTDNCDHFTVDCFEQGGIYIDKYTFPNNTWKNAKY